MRDGMGWVPGRSLPACVIFSVLGLASMPSKAEKGWQFELQAGTSIPTRSLAGADLQSGFGLEGMVIYGFTPNFAGYFGTSWHRHGVDARLTGSEAHVQASGYALGVQWADRFNDGALGYRLRLGTWIGHLGIENGAGRIVADSGHGAGFDVGFALVVPPGAQWSLTPEIRYRVWSREMVVGAESRTVALRSFILGIGLTRPF